MSVYTEFGKLKEVIVGVEYNFNKRVMDFTFKNMYKENMNLSEIYAKELCEYEISSKLIDKRNEGLNNLSEILLKHSVKVYRPEMLDSPEYISSPTYKTITSSASNVRDLVFTYSDKIIETPISVKNRLFENRALQSIFENQDQSVWFKSPQPELELSRLDLLNWKDKRDYKNTDKKYSAAIDAANCIKIGKDIICNVGSYNQYKGYEWLKKVIPEAQFHMVQIADNHIDGTLMPLRPGCFLMNGMFANEKNIRSQLPPKFKSWDIIFTQDQRTPDEFLVLEDYFTEMDKNLEVTLASTRGMDTNVFSIDENKVIVLDSAVKTMDLLDSSGFEVIPVDLKYGEMFAGGVHCSTLDLSRDDEFIDYTK